MKHHSKIPKSRRAEYDRLVEGLLDAGIRAAFSKHDAREMAEFVNRELSVFGRDYRIAFRKTNPRNEASIACVHASCAMYVAFEDYDYDMFPVVCAAYRAAEEAVEKWIVEKGAA